MNGGRPASFRISLSGGVVIAAVAAFCTIYYGLLTGKEIFVHDSIIWYGSFHYYIEMLLRGHFPYWDPYLMTGSYFYPNISHQGLLDPVVLIGALVKKITGVSTLTVYVYFRIFRMVIAALGAFFIYRHITKSRASATIAAAVFFYALPPGYFKQYGAVDVVYLTPFALYFLLLFLESPASPRKYLYLVCLAVISGISMNIYIPAFYLFNLGAFIIVLFLLRISSFREFAGSFRDRRHRIIFAASILLVTMMAAPPLMIMSRDASGGELFPILRIAQKNDGKLKKIVASEAGGSSLSAEFYGRKGVFDSYGNIVNLLYPEMWNIPFFAEHDFMAEINQYIGLIPLIFCVTGLIYSKSRYRLLSVIMLALITVNMFSFEGMSGHPYNWLQKIFNGIFPPLKMIDVRETLTAFSLFYLCMLLSLGLEPLLEGNQFVATAKEKYRQILAAGTLIIVLKVAITWFFGRKIVAASKQDLFTIEQVVIFILLIFLFARGSVSRKTVCVALVSLIFAELFLYNYLYRRDMLTDRRPLDRVVEIADRRKDHFQYFREIIASPPGLAFGETILRVKGVLTYGNNHSLFSTKRYYDLLTHVGLEDQLVLGGVMYPVLRFFPSNDVLRTADRSQTLDYFERGGGKEADRLLLEDDTVLSGEDGAKMKDFSQYEDLPGFSPYELRSFVTRYLAKNGQEIAGRRADVSVFLNTRDYFLAVREFSPNDITISVKTDKAGYLLYNDGWSRYWRAFDGEREIPVIIANYNSKAVYLTKGAHDVRFVFDPVHYKMGLVLYYAGLLAAAGMIIFLYFSDAEGRG